MTSTDEPGREEAFDAAGLGRHLLRSVRAGALGTLDPAGSPFTSLVTVATDSDGTPLILTSRLASHTVHLERDPRVSLLLAQAGRGDPLAHPRLTIAGQAERGAGPRIRERFIARHPKAQLYVDFPDFSFWRITILSGHLNGGFARAAGLTASGLLTSLAGADSLIAAEAEAVRHMNEDHAGALELYATRLAGLGPGPWRATGLDPDGLDLALGDRTARITFPGRVTDPGGLRRILKELADLCRKME
ncbi:MAG: DUF2470 domain-containing protein [Microvirga sp.]